MKILVSNDDGLQAQGIYELVKTLSQRHEVTVVAPDRERSAISHSVTFYRPLQAMAKKLGDLDVASYITTGTPADCIKIALGVLMKQPPDLIVSGINHGSNLGSDMAYSGTIAAAREGAMLGFPSMAVSVHGMPRLGDGAQKLRTVVAPSVIEHFDVAAELALEVGEWLVDNPLSAGRLLNVNVPDLPKQSIRGVRIAEQGNYRYSTDYQVQKTAQGEVLAWYPVMRERPAGYIPDSDADWCDAGYATVTPLTYKQTDQQALEQMCASVDANWLKFGGER